jgi:hypothetical protein
VRLLFCLFASGVFAQTYPFRLEKPGEVRVVLEMRSPGSDWSQPGREAALADIRVDGLPMQQVMLYAGSRSFHYPLFLSRLSAGEHRLTVERNVPYSAPGSGLEVQAVHFDPVPEDDAVLANAPILFARRNTVGKFTDIPLLHYCERLPGGLLQYTVIFSNEDGGTSTRALMARWGRTTDIEYIYKVRLDTQGQPQSATIQAPGHKEVEYTGPREGRHPLLIPVTDNNMVSSEAPSPIRYQIPPLLVDLRRHSREQAMDEHPFVYRVMAQELIREGKLRPFGTVDGEKISDPRNYLFLEAKYDNRDAGIAVLVRVRGEPAWRSSSLGRLDYAISRSGWIRTTVELPPRTRAEQIAEIGFECLAMADTGRPLPVAGQCGLLAVGKAFLLRQDYLPGESFWSLPEDGSRRIPTGQMRTFPLPERHP